LTNRTRPQARPEQTSYYLPVRREGVEATKVAIENEDGAGAEKTESVKPALVAELTWAKLYTKAMHKDLVAISTAIAKNQPTTGGSGMKKSAEQLHDQLQDANRTVDELSDQAGIRSVPDKK
jgi:hypothetical protein